jgi:hypothetical protein
MRTVPTKDTSEESLEDVHNQIVRQIQRGKKLLKFEQLPTDNKHSEDGSQERFGQSVIVMNGSEVIGSDLCSKKPVFLS